MAAVSAASATFMLALLSGLHVYWACGGRWPGRDRRDLSRKVSGSSDRMASPAACLLVAALLLCAAHLVAVAGGFAGGLPANWARWGARAVAGAFALRGATGLFAERIDPRIAGTAFVALNRSAYNPLSFALAALCWGATVA